MWTLCYHSDPDTCNSFWERCTHSKVKVISGYRYFGKKHLIDRTVRDKGLITSDKALIIMPVPVRGTIGISWAFFISVNLVLIVLVVCHKYDFGTLQEMAGNEEGK